MVSLFYSEILLHYKDCYKGCGVGKSDMGGRGCDVLTVSQIIFFNMTLN